MAGDVALQLVDGHALGSDNPVYEVSYGHNADESLAIKDWDVAHSVHSHQLHALFNGVGRRRGHRGSEDLTDLGILGGLAFDGDFARVIAFGNDADKLLPGKNRESADVLFGHQLDGFKNSGIGRDAPNLSLLVSNEFIDDTGNHGQSFRCRRLGAENGKMWRLGGSFILEVFLFLIVPIMFRCFESS